MDKESRIVDGSNAFGYMATHNVTHPDCIIIMDEASRNTSQKGDGYVSGKLMLCNTKKTPQQKLNAKSKH